MTMMCETCGASFEANRKNHRHCSKTCNSVAQNAKRSVNRAQGLKFCRMCQDVKALASFEPRARLCRECSSIKAAGRHRCSKCAVVKPLDDFNPRSGGRRDPRCKGCLSAIARERNARPEIRARRRNRLYVTRFGITSVQYDEMVEQQDGLCAICRRKPNGRRNTLAVDHDHSCCSSEPGCGRCVRALLCLSCNTALGAIRDDPAVAEAMAAYLRRYASHEAIRQGTESMA